MVAGKCASRSKSTLGYKGFARTDEEGYIDRVHTSPA